MKRQTILSFRFAVAGLLAAVSTAGAYEPRIELSPGSDRVLPIKQRTTVLDVSDKLLSRDVQDRATMAASVKDPFQFGAADVQVAASETKPEIQRMIRYSDEAMLGRVHEHFGPLVKGYMKRADKSYLQLRGGQLVESGSSFPVRLPSLPDGDPIRVTVGEVTQRSYELRINKASMTVTMPGYEAVNSETVHVAKQDIDPAVRHLDEND